MTAFIRQWLYRNPRNIRTRMIRRSMGTRTCSRRWVGRILHKQALFLSRSFFLTVFSLVVQENKTLRRKTKTKRDDSRIEKKM
jgi:hypothetical protein